MRRFTCRVGTERQSSRSGNATNQDGATAALPTRFWPHPNEAEMAYKNNNRKAERASMIGTVWILIAFLTLGIVVAELYRSGYLSNAATKDGDPPTTGTPSSTGGR